VFCPHLLVEVLKRLSFSAPFGLETLANPLNGFNPVNDLQHLLKRVHINRNHFSLSVYCEHQRTALLLHPHNVLFGVSLKIAERMNLFQIESYHHTPRSTSIIKFTVN